MSQVTAPRENITCIILIPRSKIHGATIGPIWGRQDPGGPHAGPMNFAIWDDPCFVFYYKLAQLMYTHICGVASLVPDKHVII